MQISPVHSSLFSSSMNQTNMVTLGHYHGNSFAAHMIYNRIQSLPLDDQQYLKSLIHNMDTLNAISIIVDKFLNAYHIAKMHGEKGDVKDVKRILDITAWYFFILEVRWNPECVYRREKWKL